MKRKSAHIFFFLLCFLAQSNLFAQQNEVQRNDSDYINKDTNRKRIFYPYIMVNGGESYQQIVGALGGNSYIISGEMNGSEYVGYASNSNIFFLTGGLNTKWGWELKGIYYFNYYYGLDATGFLKENAAFYLPPDLIINGSTTLNVLDVKAIGTYSYTCSGWLIGIAKSWNPCKYTLLTKLFCTGSDKISFSYGVSLMAGELTILQPYIHGTATIAVSNGPIDTNQYYYNMDYYQEKTLMIDIGLHFDIHLWHHLIIRTMADLQTTEFWDKANFQLIDMKGNLFYSNQIGGFTLPDAGRMSNNKMDGAGANLSIGIGYEF